MEITKRRLLPISLLVPSLLALSATAQWNPYPSTWGTGFYSGYAITDNGNTANVLAGYYNPNVPQTLLYQAALEAPDGSWSYSPEFAQYSDNFYAVTQASYPANIGVSIILWSSPETGLASEYADWD